MTSTGDGTIYKSTSFRAEASLVESAREIFDAHDLSMSAAITLFLEACVQEGRIPNAVMNPGSSSPDSEFANAILRSVAQQVALPDFGNPLIPADVFADEIVLEFKDCIFWDCHGPWEEMVYKILDISSWDSQFADGSDDEEEDFYEEIDLLEEFMPEKLPYDYARDIVEANTKAWAKAEREAGIKVDSPYDTMMGNLLKRSHLTLDKLMERLVEAGAVEEKDGDNYNRSLGKMVESLVAFLKEKGRWDAPEPMYGVPFKEVKEGLIDEIMDGHVAFRVNCDYTRYLAYEHPIFDMFEDVAVGMNLAIEDSYTSLFDIDEFDVLDSNINYLELEDTLLSLFDNCQFKYPPKTVYDECVKRYLHAMETAEPGTVAAKCLSYAKAPFDYEHAYLYPIAIDMDAEVWADVYNREAFFTTAKAVRDGKIPNPSTFVRH